MPSLGLIPINCLACSNEIIVPVQSQYLAAKGMTYLFDTVSKVRRTINPSLKIKGIVLTLFTYIRVVISIVIFIIKKNINALV